MAGTNPRFEVCGAQRDHHVQNRTKTDALATRSCVYHNYFGGTDFWHDRDRPPEQPACLVSLPVDIASDIHVSSVAASAAGIDELVGTGCKSPLAVEEAFLPCHVAAFQLAHVAPAPTCVADAWTGVAAYDQPVPE